MSVDIHLPYFDGPLPLLLHLIRKEEMDIFNINIYEITTQYLDYIRRMKELDLETAGDFVAMAATLIQIKSQMLLPQYNEQGEVVEVEDPRRELINRLLEYQRFQEASQKMYARPLLGRDIWVRGIREELPENEHVNDIVIEDGGLFALISHYRHAIKNMKKGIHRVAQKTKSIAGQILLIKDRLIVGQRVILKDLINAAEDMRSEMLITFLSVLELGKMGMINVFQAEVYGDIYLTALRVIDGHAIDRVQEYETDATKVAESLFDIDPETVSLAPEEDEESVEAASDDDIALAELADASRESIADPGDSVLTTEASSEVTSVVTTDMALSMSAEFYPEEETEPTGFDPKDEVVI
jgi:segregation and condensation protein A